MLVRFSLALVLFGVAQSCTGGSKASTSMEDFLRAEAVARAGISVVPLSAKGEQEGTKEFVLRNWAIRQESPCLFSLITENSMAEFFPSPTAVRGIVSRPDKFAIFFDAVNATIDEEGSGNYWVNGSTWWRVHHAVGKEYFSFQYLDPDTMGPFMFTAIPFGDANGIAPYRQLIGLVEETQAEFSDTPEAYLFSAKTSQSIKPTESSEAIGVSSWGEAKIEIFVHKQTLQPTMIRVSSSAGKITCKIEYLETLALMDDSILDYVAPERAIILYDERE